MAKSRISVAEDQFVCSICLDLLMNPVTIPCGHSYCMNCITSHWNQEDLRGIYSCPQCRKTFTPRPDLGKNVMIAEMLEKLKKTEPQDAVLAGAGDVKCDVCTGRKNNAVKSCLVCLNSYCQTHFEEFHPDKRHKVINATGRLKEMICQKHNKILEVFCCTDKKCFCILCTLDEHRNQTVSAAEEKSKMQGHLREMQRIQEREHELQELRETVESQKRSAQAAVEDIERIFTDFIRSIERSRSEVTQLIRVQERASVSQAEERLEQLKQEIADLRRNKAELEQLSDTMITSICSRISVAEDQFVCSICLDLLMNPVTIPCGHSYCMNCITSHWNQEDLRGIYSCPQCRKTFTPRPDLGKNVMIAEMLEKLKKTEPQDAVLAGAGDVKCDVCTGRKNNAVKSCLVCLNSYCQTHFEEFHPDKRHKVINATGRLKEMICQKHSKILEVFCCTDQQFICVLCKMDEHRNHETVSAAEEKSKMQGHLREMQRTIQQRIQKKEVKLQELREAVESHKQSAQATVEASEKIFTDLIRSIERSRSEVTQLIRAQERASVSQAQERLEQLKQQIADLRRNKAELEQLSDTDDHVHLLQNLKTFSVSGSSKLPRIIISSVLSFDEVGKSVSKLRDQLNQYCREAIDNISDTVKHIQIILGPDFETRGEYLRYFQQFTLDPNTTNKNLSLSDRSRTITSTHTDLMYPDHPDRFDSVVQVLCRESVSGRCYWEVDCDQSDRLGVSVSYKNINRKGRGNESKFGHNNQSWILLCSPPKYIFLHNNIKTKLIVASSSSRIGVYVDHNAGILSFYSVSDKMTLIHKVHATFNQPLYPGFSLGSNASVKLCNVKT